MKHLESLPVTLSYAKASRMRNRLQYALELIFRVKTDGSPASVRARQAVIGCLVNGRRDLEHAIATTMAEETPDAQTSVPSQQLPLPW